MSEEQWDVEKYKTEHECDEHWELRRKFMLAHQDTLPEDELVCMAQVFTNIEFLGCRYPNETMIRVAELAKGVVEDFREKKKGTLKRTFVAASDAASSKVKGLKRSNTNNSEDSALAKRPLTFLPSTDNQNSARIIHPGDGPLGKFVCILVPNRPMNSLLEQSVAGNRFQLKKETKLLPNGQTECVHTLNGEEFCRVTAADQKSAKDLAVKTTFDKLRQQCFSIVIKDRFVGQAVEQADVGCGVVGTAAKQPQERIAESNVGSKLMKLMGWTGGGLGSQAQGRVEPVENTSTVHRAGLGLEPTADYRAFRRTITNYLHQWLTEGANQDLVFSTDFDKEHRKIVHQIAQRLGLKSQSYGNEANRRLVLSKKISLWNLVQELAGKEGEFGKYKLLDPGAPWDDTSEST